MVIKASQEFLELLDEVSVCCLEAENHSEEYAEGWHDAIDKIKEVLISGKKC